MKTSKAMEKLTLSVALLVVVMYGQLDMYKGLNIERLQYWR